MPTRLQTCNMFSSISLQSANRYLLCVMYVFLFWTMNNICYSRSKLAFARGAQSDSISFVNVFKVMCLLAGQQQVQPRSMHLHICLMAAVYKTLSCFFSLSGMVLIQKERTAETSKGEENNTKHQLWINKHGTKDATLFSFCATVVQSRPLTPSQSSEMILKSSIVVQLISLTYLVIHIHSTVQMNLITLQLTVLLNAVWALSLLRWLIQFHLSLTKASVNISTIYSSFYFGCENQWRTLFCSVFILEVNVFFAPATST